MKHLIVLLLISFLGTALIAADPQPLAIGAAAPDFKLPGVDGKTYTLNDFSGADILVIVFTCNHCPTAQAYEQRIIHLSNDYIARGVQVVAISPNDPNAVRLDELGYSDIGDSFEEMKMRAEDKMYPFPYLYDGKTQATALAYGPIATPHIFIFDKARKLRFQGRFDNMENPNKLPSETDTKNALDALLAGKPVPVETTKVFGCSVKWASKNNQVEEFKKKWAAESVSIEKIDEAGLKAVAKNKDGEKLRLINVWATWCGPCVTEFPDLITINRMYRGRDFEMVTISADVPEQEEKALKFLKKQESSTTNYLFSLDDKYKLIESLDPEWGGALPYTMLVEPGGKVVYRKQGPIDVSELKKAIVDHPMIGRVYNN
ncbi:MAG: redoxin domain-containing protein [Saprospiraceae bacterium]|nr:redoxin domain-containing protein [Saprospiraceae bacterium]